MRPGVYWPFFKSNALTHVGRVGEPDGGEVGLGLARNGHGGRDGGAGEGVGDLHPPAVPRGEDGGAVAALEVHPAHLGAVAVDVADVAGQLCIKK